MIVSLVVQCVQGDLHWALQGDSCIVSMVQLQAAVICLGAIVCMVLQGLCVQGNLTCVLQGLFIQDSGDLLEGEAGGIRSKEDEPGRRPCRRRITGKQKQAAEQEEQEEKGSGGTG